MAQRRQEASANLNKPCQVQQDIDWKKSNNEQKHQILIIEIELRPKDLDGRYEQKNERFWDRHRG